MIEIPTWLQSKDFRFVLIKPKSKRPFEDNWQKTANYKYNDKKLIEHIAEGGNYGVACGFGNLVVIDCDKEAIEKRVNEILPKTARVRTGRGGTHYYFLCEDITNPIRLTETVAGDVGDVQWKGKQVVGPGSTHENGNIYSVEIHGKPQTVSMAQIKFALHPWLSIEKGKESESIPQDSSLKITEVIDTSKLKKHGKEYYGSHPLHGSDSGMNFWVNPSKNVWHCFRHDSGGGPLSWIAVKEGIIDCNQSISGALRGETYKKTFEAAIKKYGMKEVVVQIDKEPVRKEKVAKREEWEFENILPKDHFITKYIEKGQSLSDAYPEYFFMGAINALSMIANRCIRIELSPKPHYTNIWGICIGKSTVSRKTTAIDLNLALLSLAGLGKQLPPDDTTPEAFIDSMKDCAQINMLKDEFGLFLSKARLKYQSGIDSLFSRLYDCPDSYERHLRKEKIKINDVYISMLGAMVPNQLSRLASVDDILSGFFPRMLFVCPERKKGRKRLRHLNEEDEKLETELVLWIRNLHHLTSSIKEQKELIHAILTEGAMDKYNDWCEEWEERIVDGGDDDGFSPFFGRASIIALKLAALFKFGSYELKKQIEPFSNFNSISIFSNISRISKTVYYERLNRGNNTNFTNLFKRKNKEKFPALLVIDDKTLEMSLFYVSKLFLPYSRKVLTEVESQASDQAIQRIYQLALRHAKNGCIEHSDLLRKANIKSKDFAECIKTLQESGRLHISSTETGKVIYTPLVAE